MRTRAPFASLPALATAALLLFLQFLQTPAAGAAVPGECDGVTFPQHIQAQGETLSLNGLGLRKATIFGIKVYVAGLYVAHPTADAQAILHARDPVEMQLRFVFHVTAGQLRSAWQEGFEKSAGAQLPRLRARIARLDGWMQGASSGQLMTFLRVPGVGIQYALDGAVQGTIPGDDFATAFLAIWLGASPPSSALRAGLLGGPCT
jgi:Chalcone isomerase-like